MNKNTPDSLLLEAKKQIQKGEYSAASEVINTLLETDKSHIEALYCLAVCQRKQSNYNDALTTLDQIHLIEPDHCHAFQEKGYNHQALKHNPQSINAFEKAVTLNPAMHGSWNALTQLEDYSRKSEAEQQLARLKSLPPELVSVSSLLHQNKLHKAETLCRQFLKRQPHHPEAMRLLAELGVKFHVLDDAEFLLEKCLEFKPDFTHARLDYVSVLHRRQKFPQALDQSRKLYETDKTNPSFELSLANALQATGDYDQAIQSYSNLLVKHPDNYTIHLTLGHALKTVGQVDEAITSYRQAYQLKADYGDAYWSLANLKTYQFDDHEIESMRHYEQVESTSKLDRIQLCFALGKAFEDRHDYEPSFNYYQRGNQLKTTSTKFDVKRFTNELSYQKTHFNADFFKSKNGVGCQSSDPIFIVGLPRAGSTLLEQILASHSQVDGTLELANVIAMAHRFNGRIATHEEPRYPAILNDLPSDAFATLGERYIRDTKAHRQGAAFFIDKMPNNFRHIALILLILPNAKIIDARREPMACCFSGYKQLFAEGQEFSYDLTDIGTYYREYVDIMDHWEQEMPGRILRVQHEDVIEDLETQVHRILDYCGLEFEQNCVDFHQTKRAIRTPSSEQVRQPIYKTSVDLWRHYETYLDPLKAALKKD